MLLWVLGKSCIHPNSCKVLFTNDVDKILTFIDLPQVDIGRGISFLLYGKTCISLTFPVHTWFRQRTSLLSEIRSCIGDYLAYTHSFACNIVLRNFMLVKFV